MPLYALVYFKNNIIYFSTLMVLFAFLFRGPFFAEPPGQFLHNLYPGRG